MNSIGSNIKLLRRAKGITQEELSAALHISCQAISKWENGACQPDICLIPAIASYFSVTIDELFDFHLQAMTDKERFIRSMADTEVLKLGAFTLKHGDSSEYYVDSENFCTNARIAKLGEFFADRIRENHLEFDGIVGMAYHGISFAAAAAVSLYQKYGVTTFFCHDRKAADSRGRMLCGYTPKEGERVVIIDDLISSGKTLAGRIDRLIAETKAVVAAVIVITQKEAGAAFIRDKYNAPVISVINDEDIRCALKSGIV